jgi:hypothetical protein
VTVRWCARVRSRKAFPPFVIVPTLFVPPLRGPLTASQRTRHQWTGPAFRAADLHSAQAGIDCSFDVGHVPQELRTAGTSACGEPCYVVPSERVHRAGAAVHGSDDDQHQLEEPARS